MVWKVRGVRQRPRHLRLSQNAFVGEDLTPWLIRYGYEQGAFPMSGDDCEVDWFQPTRRALFPMSGIRVSRSLRRVIRSGMFEITFDRAFESVMRGCLRPGDNWISERMIRAYTQIHNERWAHSCEVWRRPGQPTQRCNRAASGTPSPRCDVRGEAAGDGEKSDVSSQRRDMSGKGELVGGLYGLAIGTCFCAESMFHRATNASKVALWATVEKCRSLGFTLFDAQVMNPHLASLGAFEVPHSHYMGLLNEAMRARTEWS